VKSRPGSGRRPGSLRIVAGRYGGRLIRVPGGDGVRPTPDRVREALFSILGGFLPGRAVLDLYAGSGALGLEALSRGASRVTFIEADMGVLKVLEGNVAALEGAAECLIISGRVEAVLAGGELHGAPFDLILADPPYAEYPGKALFALILSSGALAPEGLVVVERERRVSPETIITGSLSLSRTERYGRVSLDFYRNHPGACV